MRRITLTPGLLIGIGVGMMVLGTVLPLLIMLKLLESTFFLNFSSFICQMVGLMLGTIGVVTCVRRPKM